ncbi:MAG: flagellar hook-length control protein FliK [Oscillospiraceae bacterium]|nr:flagellar hook-length control protein FliK [Oscillospiraceae bacterium]
MNAAQDMIMQMLTVQKSPYSPAAPAKRSSDESTAFGDLLTRKHAQANEPAAQENADTAAQPESAVPAEEQELTSEQMELLAAMNASTKTILFVPTETAPTESAAQPAVQMPALDAAAPVTQTHSADTVQVNAQQPVHGAPAAPVAETVVPTTQQAAVTAPAAQEAPTQGAAAAPQQSELPVNREMPVRSDSTAAAPTKSAPAEITYTAPVANAQTAHSDTGAATDTARKPDIPVTTEQTAETAQGETVLTTAQRIFTTVEAAPVKVAEAPVLDTTAPQMEAELTKLIADTAQTGKESITIRLAPETLGEIEVRLTRELDGALRVVMTTTTDRAQALLEKNAAGLQTLLGANTRGEVEIEVTTRQDAQQNSFERDAQHHGGQEHEQKQQNHQQKRSSEDFLQQLRLGLLSLDVQAI